MKMVLGMQSCACKGIPIKRKDEGLEVKSGNLLLIQSHQGRSVRVPVHVRVYQSCFEHYAIVNRDCKFTNKGIFVNLKNSTVIRTETRESEFLMVPDNVEGTGYTFQARNATEAEDWTEVLRASVSQGSPTSAHPAPSLSPVIPRMPLMPTLAEEEES
ncbi:uncharacterized protein LOC134266445 [Saccostrea cucullata]|uniref:uncharacterized protein LOC134262486 n=1 Tax=Saccostrea cuccullata TaxID=36930 RepID=UPI002ED5D152